MNQDDADILPDLDALLALPADARLHAIAPDGDVTPEAILTVVDHAAQRAAQESSTALSLTEFALDIADRAGAPLARARARRARVRALSYAGRFEEALGVSMDAIEIATAGDELIEAARARQASMHALGELGRFDEAIAVGTEARELFLRLDAPALAARADINIGIVQLRRDQPASALAAFARAGPALRDDPVVLGHLENSRGEALVATNDFRGAGQAFAAALRAFEAAGASLTAAIAEGNLADLAAREGDLQRALFHFEGARRRFDESGSPAHLARVLAEQADAKAALGLPRDALREYEEAIAELDRCGTPLEAARARRGMGLALVRLGQTAEAETALAAAATAFEELGHTTARARVDIARAELALENDRIDEARRMATRAMAALLERPADCAAARHLLARIALVDADTETADAELAAALVAARRLDLAPLLADILATRGMLHRQAGRVDQAIADLTEAVSHVERVRGALQADRFRAAFLGDRSATYEALVGALLDRPGTVGVAEAFAAAEQAKSRSLLDQVGGAVESTEPSPDEDPVAAELHCEYVEVRAELNALYSRIADDGAAASQAASMAWRDAVRQREETLDTLEGRMDTVRGARLDHVTPRGLEEVQRTLAADEVLIEYFIADGRIAAFIVSCESILVCRDIGAASDVTERLQRFQFQIGRTIRPDSIGPGRAARMLDDVRLELAGLHDALLAPVRSRIDRARRLIIVPHGSLHLVPFHALWSDDSYLIERHEIRVVPSASLHVHLHDARSLTPRRHRPLVIGVADAVAPRVADEAALVADLVGCEPDHVLTGANASVEHVTTLAQQASMIHFAGHGRFLVDNPSGSGLRLHDRWLTVRDICAMGLRADLVTLSGCDTGLNRVQAGDELLGLLRSFFAAGARAIIVSLWRVHDEHAATLMTRLYDDWPRTDAPPTDLAARLRNAQLSMIREHPHPAFWAPFTLVGTP